MNDLANGIGKIASEAHYIVMPTRLVDELEQIQPELAMLGKLHILEMARSYLDYVQRQERAEQERLRASIQKPLSPGAQYELSQQAIVQHQNNQQRRHEDLAGRVAGSKLTHRPLSALSDVEDSFTYYSGGTHPFGKGPHNR